MKDMLKVEDTIKIKMCDRRHAHECSALVALILTGTPEGYYHAKVSEYGGMYKAMNCVKVAKAVGWASTIVLKRSPLGALPIAPQLHEKF